jgi:hypothetical protein
MDHKHSFGRLADKICALFCDGTEASDKELVDVLASLTSHEIAGLRDEMARRADYDRAHPRRRSLLQFPSILEATVIRQ